MSRSARSLAALLLAAPVLAGFADPPLVSVESWVHNPGQNTASVTGTAGLPISSTFGVGASYASTRVVVTFDFSAIAGGTTVTVNWSNEPCEPNARRCEFTLPGSRLATVSVVFSSPALGPVGQARMRVDPADGVDPNPGDNSSTVEVDFISGKATAFAVTMPSVGEGAIGDTITLPATVVNLGSNALGWAHLTPSSPSGGRYLGGGSGCGATTCLIKNVLPGQPKTVQLRYKIDSCPTVSQPAGLSVSRDSSITFDYDASKIHFTLRVAGCPSPPGPRQLAGSSGGSPGESVITAAVSAAPNPAGPPTSARSAPSSSSEPEPPVDDAAAALPRANQFLVTGAAVLILLIAAAALLSHRRRRAVTAAASPGPYPSPGHAPQASTIDLSTARPLGLPLARKPTDPPA